MAPRRNNFFKTWSFTQINEESVSVSKPDELRIMSSGPINEEDIKIPKRRSRNRNQSPDNSHEKSTQTKFQLSRKSDDMKICTGDCVLYQENETLIEAWYLYNIEFDLLNKKINVFGLRLIDWDTLEKHFGIKNELFDSTKEAASSQLILIPEIEMLSSDGSFEVIPVCSSEDGLKNDVKLSSHKYNALDSFSKETRFVKYLFDPEKEELKNLDYDHFKKTCTGDGEAFERFKQLVSNADGVDKKAQIKADYNLGKVTTESTNSWGKSLSESQNLNNNNKRALEEENDKNSSMNKKPTLNKEGLDSAAWIEEATETNFYISSKSQENTEDSFATTGSDGSNSNEEYVPDKDETNEDIFMDSDNIISTTEEEDEKELHPIKTVDRKSVPAILNNFSKSPEKEHKLTTAANYANSYQKNHLNLRLKNINEYDSATYCEGKEDHISKFRSQLSANQYTLPSNQKVSTNPIDFQVPGREEEFSNIYSRIASFVNNGVGSSIYISGVPGTGKSFTVKKTVECLLNQNTRAFSFAEINGLKLINPDDCYENLCDKLQISLKVKEKAVIALERFFSLKKDRKIVLLLDEIDVLLSHDSEKLYNFFNWPYLENSNLFVIAIGNKMNLSEQLNSKTNSRLGRSNTIQFASYGVTQLETILQYRLTEECAKNTIYLEKKSGKVVLFSSSKSSCYADTHKSKFKWLKIVFPKTAIQFLAKTGSASSSDVRTVKGIGLSAMELAEQEYIKKHGVIYNYEHTMVEEEEDEAEQEFEIKELKVTTAYISQAKGMSHSASVKDYVSSLSTISKFILFAAIQIANEYRTSTLYFRNVIDKLDTMLDNYRNKAGLKSIVAMMEMECKDESSSIRIIDWDFAVNQLSSSDLVEITRLSNDRVNLFTLKNIDGIEEGLSSFIKQLK